MTLNANDLRTSYLQLFSGMTERITFRSQNTDGTFTSYTIPNARRRRISKTEGPPGGELASSAMIWEITQQGLDAAIEGQAPAPKSDDEITDKNNLVFVILGLGDVQLMGQVHACRCTLGRGQ